MTQQLADHLGVLALYEQQGRRRVPQIVHASAADPGRRVELVQESVHASRVDGRSVGRGEHQPLISARMSVPQPILGNAASRSSTMDPLGASKGNADGRPRPRRRREGLGMAAQPDPPRSVAVTDVC